MTLYGYEHSETTTASTDAVYALWEDTGSWPEWDTAVRSVTLDGPFAVGTDGVMVIEGMPPIPFTLTEVTPGRSFTDETRLPDALLVFEHLVEAIDGGSRITYRVRIDGPEELGPAVTEDTPDAMRALAKLAELAELTKASSLT